MEINNSISFGQTFVQSTLNNLSKTNKNKVKYSYALGELYPMDISLGGTISGDLTVSLRRCELWDNLIINNAIRLNNKNIASYYIAKGLNFVKKKLYDCEYPIKRHTIKNLNNKSAKDIAMEINYKIIEYNNIYGKKFIN